MKKRWSDLFYSKYHAGAAAVGGIMATVPAFAETYTMSSFGVDTLIAGVIGLALAGYVAVAGAVTVGLSADAIFGVLSKWIRKSFGGR